jgi:hypothetical protein
MSGLLLDFERLGLVGEQPPRKLVKRLQLATGRALPRRVRRLDEEAGRAGDEPWLMQGPRGSRIREQV